MSPKYERLHRKSTRTLPPLALATAGLLVVLSALLPAGCAKRSPVEADSREIRLTQGDGVNAAPVYSPDGRYLAYVSKPKDDASGFSVNVLPAEGGAAQPVCSDSSGLRPLAWSADGRRLYVYFDSDRSLKLMGLDGQVVKSFPRPPLANFNTVAPDGSTFLFMRFNGDNYDMALRAASAKGEPEVLAPTPTWEIQGCFGPKKGEVTVVSQASFGASSTELAIWSPENRDYTPLPLPRAYNITPAWSPEGRYLAYASDQAGNMDLWILDSVSGRTTQVTAGPEEDTSPTWTPDGNRIGFTRRTHTSHLFAGDPVTLEQHQITQGPDRDYEPVISDDGKWVAFTRERAKSETGQGTLVLGVASVDGQTVRELALPGVSLNMAGMCWSPDASQVVFVGDDGTGNIDLYRTPREGGQVTRITVAPGSDIIPAWSPDGRLMAYSRAAGGETQIWVIPATGGLAHQISTGKGVNQVPAWSPDSRKVAYLSLTPTGAYEIWVAPVDDPEGAHRVNVSDGFQVPQVWSADGREVIVYRRETGGGAPLALYAVPVDGGAPVRIGEASDKPTATSPYFNLTAAGETYRDRLYPGGLHVFVDGENQASIYSVRVGELLKGQSGTSEAAVVR